MELYDQFLTKLLNREPFSFSRFGDGEWSAILQRPGKNTDGHEYFPDMGAALAEVLRSRPAYPIGIQNHALRTLPEVAVWLALNGFHLGNDFVNADVWHNASIEGQFKRFFEALRHKSVLLVGPHEVAKLGIHNYWVEVPSLNCWKSKDVIMKGIDNYIDYVGIVLFCASMASNVMIHELYQKHGKVKTLLDMGSVFMPYVGVANRSYHKKIIQREARR